MPDKISQIKTHFKSVDPILYAELNRMDLTPLTPRINPKSFFRHLCHEIIGQQLASQAADAIVARFLSAFPGGLVTPARVMALSESDLRYLGMSWAKARYVRDLAQKVAGHEVVLTKLPGLTDAEVITDLVKVKGIGPWTAEMFLIFTLGREDIFSFGDLGLTPGFQQLYHLPDSEVLPKLKRLSPLWSPYRSYASLALWHAKDS